MSTPASCRSWFSSLFSFLSDTPAPEFYTLSYTTLFRSSLGPREYVLCADEKTSIQARVRRHASQPPAPECSSSRRSEEHTSELQSRENLVCRLLLEKKNSHNHNRSRSYPATRETSDITL